MKRAENLDGAGNKDLALALLGEIPAQPDKKITAAVAVIRDFITDYDPAAWMGASLTNPELFLIKFLDFSATQVIEIIQVVENEVAKVESKVKGPYDRDKHLQTDFYLTVMGIKIVTGLHRNGAVVTARPYETKDHLLAKRESCLKALDEAMASAEAQKNSNINLILMAVKDLVEGFEDYTRMFEGAGLDNTYYEMLASMTYVEMLSTAKEALSVYGNSVDLFGEDVEIEDISLALEFLNRAKITNLIGKQIRAVLN